MPRVMRSYTTAQLDDEKQFANNSIICRNAVGYQPNTN